ncbi:hypothetical protein NX059_000994 [Plenodomus lindquistii]|nr:hypothetical protein NX059_000994 [Plenodomus lindquistii]
MSYDSTITFTLDTICPWTYIAYLRLQKALTSYRASNPSSPVTFTLKLAPYQLYPEFSHTGEDKHDWYQNEKYNGSVEKMHKYSDYMKNLGQAEGVELNFDGGEIANTLHAHRILAYLQAQHSPAHALRALESLYVQYFTQRQHPSSASTLTKACVAAGVSEEEAVRVVADQSEELAETKAAIREQSGNGVDSVPYVVFEGRRRDFTYVGAKDVGEYEKVLRQVEKECL